MLYFNTHTGQTKTQQQWEEQYGADGFYVLVKDGTLIQDDVNYMEAVE